VDDEMRWMLGEGYFRKRFERESDKWGRGNKKGSAYTRLGDSGVTNWRRGRRFRKRSLRMMVNDVQRLQNVKNK